MRLRALCNKDDGHVCARIPEWEAHGKRNTTNETVLPLSSFALALRRQLDASAPRQSRSIAKASPARPINPIPNSASPRRLNLSSSGGRLARRAFRGQSLVLLSNERRGRIAKLGFDRTLPGHHHGSQRPHGRINLLQNTGEIGCLRDHDGDLRHPARGAFGIEVRLEALQHALADEPVERDIDLAADPGLTRHRSPLLVQDAKDHLLVCSRDQRLIRPYPRDSSRQYSRARRRPP